MELQQAKIFPKLKYSSHEVSGPTDAWQGKSKQDDVGVSGV